MSINTCLRIIIIGNIIMSIIAPTLNATLAVTNVVLFYLLLDKKD